MEYRIDFSKITTWKDMQMVIEANSFTVSEKHKDFKKMKHLLIVD